MNSNKYTRLRENNPEFIELTDEDLHEYLAIYDTHMALGFQPSSLPLVVGGCFILFVDWLMFNAGSSGNITQDKETNKPALTIMNTILSSVGAASFCSILGMFSDIGNKKDVTLKFDLMKMVGAIMSGCVSITASSNNVQPTSALFIGFVGGIVYNFSVSLFEKLEIDDPL